MYTCRSICSHKVYVPYMYIGRCLGGLITPAYSLMLRLSTPVYQGRDAICLVQTLKIRPAQLSCLGGSAGRSVCLESRTLRVRVPPEAALFLLKKKELSSGIVACICLVSITGLYMYMYRYNTRSSSPLKHISLSLSFEEGTYSTLYFGPASILCNSLQKQTIFTCSWMGQEYKLYCLLYKVYGVVRMNIHETR